MRRRTIGNAAVLGTTLVAAIGLGVAVASAATAPPRTPADPTSSAQPSGPADPGSSAATPTPSASARPADGSECADVFLVDAPAGDAVGQLCTALTASGTTLGGVTVTFTASGCTGSVVLRVSGVDHNGDEFGQAKKVTCTSGAATASFDPVAEGTAGTDICGTLLSDRYTAAEACVPIS